MLSDSDVIDGLLLRRLGRHELWHPYACMPERQRNLQACQQEMDVLAGISTGIVVTEHAHERLKERMGLPRAARQRAAERAMRDGKTHAEATGRLRRYLDGKWRDHGNCTNVRLHGEFIWFFAGTTLVTVYGIPKRVRE